MSVNYWIDAILTGFGVLIFITGMIMYLVHGYQRAKIGPSRFWPSVVGTIVSSALEQPNPRHTKIYSVAVRYRYQVGGKDHESNRVFWGPNEGPREKMAEIVAAYPAGRDVWVQHDPRKPDEAVLEPEKNTGLTAGIYYYATAMMLLGLAALGAGLYALSH
jgi:Protein of unknown function (DUF3592)